MRATVISAFIAAVLVVLPSALRAQDPPTPSEQADDTLAAALWHIAVATDTRIGFQSLEPVNPALGTLHDALVSASRDAATSATPHKPVINSPLEDALDVAIAMNPRYEWRRTGTAVVVRPLGAWSDAHDPLNQRVRQLHVNRSTDIGMLTGISNLVRTGHYVEHTIGTAVFDPFSVESGSIVDVLNALIASADLPFWQAGYHPQPPGDAGTRWDLSFILAKSTGIQCATAGSFRGGTH